MEPKRVWRHLFLVPVYLLAASLPLAFDVGANLEYEYALLASWFALVLIPTSALWLPARYLPMDGDGQAHVRAPFEIFWIFLISPLVALLPGLYAFLVGLCPCSRTGFAFWMVALLYPSWILAHALYHLVLRGRIQLLTRKSLFGALVLIGVLAAIVLGVELWTNPQKRVTSFVFGFLHGPIYDDFIAFDGGIALARGSHLLLAGSLLILAWMRWKRPTFASILALGVFGAGWAGTGILSSRFPSTVSNQRGLDDLMFGRLKGEGFTLHYRPKAPGAEAEGGGKRPGLPPLQIQRLFRDAEFHVRELTMQLGGTLPHVHVYVYPSDDRKKLWFGGGSTDVTDVYTPSVHVTAGAWPHPTLRHELVHALASGFGYHGLGFHPNMAFTEGLAVALAPGAQTLSPDDGAASLLLSGRLPDVKDLFSPLFWKVSGSRAYTVAGSLLGWLVREKGITGVRALYSGAGWSEAFKEDRDTTLKQWREAIVAGYDKDKNALFTEALYRAPGVLDDDCPHSKADFARSRADGPFTRMRQPIGWDPDTDYLPWLQALDAKDQGVRLRLWRKEIRRVATDRFAALGRLETWHETIKRVRTSPAQALEDVEMGILESDLARVLGDQEGSVAVLKALATEGQTKFFGESLRREIEARLRVESTLAADKALEWRRFLAGFRRNLPEVVAEGGPWLLSYLKMRNDQSDKTDPQSTNDLIRLAGLPIDPEMSRSFHFEWYKLIGHRLMRSGAFKDAAAVYERAAAVASTGSKAVYEEHARRATYYQQKGPLTPDMAEAEGQAAAPGMADDVAL